MQRVVRYSFAILALAGLAACGDKVTVTQLDTTTKVDNTVHSVTVTPANVALAIGQTANLVATVNAGAGVTDRTVTWSSSNTAVATVTSAGVVTAVTAGNIAIVATSNADKTVQGTAAVTVAAAVPVTVTVSTINVTKCDIFGGCTSVPATLTNVGTSNPNETGQIDVTLNVDAGGQALRSVTGILKCGTDSIVATQSVANVAPIGAEAAAAPVTLSFNAAAFNQLTGGVGGSANPNTVRNGQCTIRAIATTTGGTQSASLATAFTLNNLDIVIGNLVIPNRATDPAAKVWWGGPTVLVTALPVFYSGRTAASVLVGLNNNVGTPQVTPAPSPATFPNSQGAGGVTNDLSGKTLPGAAPTVSVVDNQGNAINNFFRVQAATTATGTQTVLCSPTGPIACAPFGVVNLDEEKPLPGALSLSNNPVQSTGALEPSNGSYLGGSFIFAASTAAGYCGPNSTGFNPANTGSPTPVCTADANQLLNNDARSGTAGVDKVTVVFQSSTSASGTFAAITTAGALAESNTATTNVLRQITTDAVGNADTSFVDASAFVASNTTAGLHPTRFGVDKTPPTITLNSGPANQATFQANGGSGNYNFTLLDNLSGVSVDAANGGVFRALVAQTRNWSGTASSSFDPTTFDGRTYTNTGAAGTFPVAQSTTDISPCVIGRFDITQAKSGAGALPAFRQDGVQVGFCTPVFFDILGNNVAASNFGATTTGGYFTTEVIAVDEAGNRAPAFVNVVAEDATNPTVATIDLPGTLTGAATVGIPATFSDNVDVVSSFGTVAYAAAGMTLDYPKTAGPGVAFDNVLTRSGTATAQIPTFIRNLQLSNGATPASSLTSGNNATSVGVSVADESGRVGSLNVTIAGSGAAVSGESNNTFSSNFTAGFSLLANNNPVWNCPAPSAGQTTGCGATGTSVPGPTNTTFTATAFGVTGVFNVPFTVVTFWYQNPTSLEWVQFGSTTSAAPNDTGVGNGRTWAYSFTWDPPASDGGVQLTPAAGGTIILNIRAIGMNSSGDAVSTNSYVLTISNQ